MKIFYLSLFLLISIEVFNQIKQRTIDELIDKTDSGWTLVKEWIDAAKNKVGILSCDTSKAKEALFRTQVTTRSPMGAIIHSTGGLLIDDDWIRIIGSGHGKLNRTVPDWNKGKSFKAYGEQPPFLLIADDAIGGFFAINGGEFGADADEVSKLDGNKVYNFFPFLWTKEGKDINKNSRKQISIEEQYAFNLDMRKQLGIDR